MIVLGVLFLVVGLAFAGTAIAGNWSSSPQPVDFLVATVTNWSTAAVFLAGMGSALLIAVGLWLLSKGGIRRARSYRARRRRERELVREREAIAAERERYAVASTTDPAYESAEVSDEPYPSVPAAEATEAGTNSGRAGQPIPGGRSEPLQRPAPPPPATVQRREHRRRRH